MPIGNPMAYLLPLLQQTGMTQPGALPTPPVGPGGGPEANPLMQMQQMMQQSQPAPQMQQSPPLAPGRAERVGEQLLNPQIPQPGQMPLPQAGPVPAPQPTIGPEDQMAQRHLGRTGTAPQIPGLSIPQMPDLSSMIPGLGGSAPAMMNSPVPQPRPDAAQLGPALLGAVNNPDAAAAQMAATGAEPPPLPQTSPVGDQLAKTMGAGAEQKQQQGGGMEAALQALQAVQPQQEQQVAPPAAISPSVTGGQVNPMLMQMLSQLQPQGQVGPSLADLLSMR